MLIYSRRPANSSTQVGSGGLANGGQQVALKEDLKEQVHRDNKRSCDELKKYEEAHSAEKARIDKAKDDIEAVLKVMEEQPAVKVRLSADF